MILHGTTRYLYRLGGVVFLDAYVDDSVITRLTAIGNQ